MGLRVIENARHNGACFIFEFFFARGNLRVTYVASIGVGAKLTQKTLVAGQWVVISFAEVGKFVLWVAASTGGTGLILGRT